MLFPEWTVSSLSIFSLWAIPCFEYPECLPARLTLSLHTCWWAVAITFESVTSNWHVHGTAEKLSYTWQLVWGYKKHILECAKKKSILFQSSIFLYFYFIFVLASLDWMFYFWTVKLRFVFFSGKHVSSFKINLPKFKLICLNPSILNYKSNHQVGLNIAYINAQVFASCDVSKKINLLDLCYAVLVKWMLQEKNSRL